MLIFKPAAPLQTRWRVSILSILCNNSHGCMCRPLVHCLFVVIIWAFVINLIRFNTYIILFLCFALFLLKEDWAISVLYRYNLPLWTHLRSWSIYSLILNIFLPYTLGHSIRIKSCNWLVNSNATSLSELILLVSHSLRLWHLFCSILAHNSCIQEPTFILLLIESLFWINWSWVDNKRRFLSSSLSLLEIWIFWEWF